MSAGLRRRIWDRDERRRWFRRYRTDLVVGAAVVVAAGFALLLWRGPDWLDGAGLRGLPPIPRQTAVDADRGRILQLGAGLLAGGALVYTGLNFRLSREGHVTDRYTKAIEQLGSQQPDVRIGAIYALERIMLDSARDHPTIVEVIAAFVREHSPSHAEAAPATDVLAAVTILGRRPPGREERGRLDLRATNLVGVNLGRMKLSSVDLREADLTDADLTDADLSGADLTDADLTRTVLAGANMTSAVLYGARMVGAVLPLANLTKAILDTADATGAVLTGAKLVGASLFRTDLSRADLIDVDLTGANLSCTELTDAELPPGIEPHRPPELAQPDLSGS